MSTNFANRLRLADELEQAFINSFNENCHPHVIIKFGIESTRLSEAHEHLRHRYDPTSQFLRYMPDSVLINTESSTTPSALIEFKVADTGVRQQSFFNRIRAICPDMNPPFLTKEDVFNVESEALNGYLNLTKLGIPVVVVGHATFRQDNPLRAQFADSIAICNEYNPNRGRGSEGSGTIIANVNFASFEPVGDFFSRVYGIDPELLQAVEQSVLA